MRILISVLNTAFFEIKVTRSASDFCLMSAV